MIKPLHIGNVKNQRVKVWSILGLKDSSHCAFIESICSKSVDGFRPESDQSAIPKNLGGMGDVSRNWAVCFGHQDSLGEIR